MRYAGPVRVRLSAPSDTAYLSEARKLAGALDVRGQPVGKLRRVLPDGTTIEAEQQGGQRALTVRSPGGAPPGPPRQMEEVIHLFASSPGGLRIVDLGTKQLAATITGLHNFTVDAVTPDGRCVLMSPAGTAGAGLAVRVDLPALSAFSYAYTVATTSGTGRGMVGGGVMSPDGLRVLWVFGSSGDNTTGAIVDGIGGFVLADAETLAPVRSPIRMSFINHCAAWSADSQHVYIGAAINTDPGGAIPMGTDQFGDPMPQVFISQQDYIACFDRDGVLQGTLKVYDWGFEPGAGYYRRVLALASARDRLYAVILTEGDMELRAYDIADGVPVEVARTTVVVASSFIAATLHVDRAGSRALLYTGDGLSEYSLTGDSLSLLHGPDASFDLSAQLANVYTSRWDAGAVQEGPRSRVGQPPDTRRFHLAGSTDVVRGYRGFDAPPVYTLDLSTYNIHPRYRLAAVGVRERTPT